MEVQTWRRPDRWREKLRWQVCEASIIQAVGRARAGRRRPGEPLDIHLWTDVPVPELGTGDPRAVERSEHRVSMALMLATEGVWLESLTDAELAYRGLVKAATLKQERWRRGGGDAVSSAALKSVRYRRCGTGHFRQPRRLPERHRRP